jgi:DNA polymerase
MTAHLHIDFETRSTVDLRLAGLHNYATDLSTDVWCMAYAFDDEPVQLWAMNDEPPIDVLMHVQAGGLVFAHNAAFEFAIWNHVCARLYDWPALKQEQMRCTAAMAYAMALPGSLEKAAAAVGIDEQKDMRGHRVMLKLCKPRDDLTWADTPELLAELYAYCKQDVEVERELSKRLLALPPAEQALYLLDQKINHRGIHVDVPAVDAAIAVVESEQARLHAAMRAVTNNAVATCTAVGQLGDWIRAQGVPVVGVAKADVLDALSGDLPDSVRRALNLRQEAAKSSTAKLVAMRDKASADGRVRGTMQYHGAGTGRWAGRGIQVHNFPRGKLSPDEVEGVFAILLGSGTPQEKAALIDCIYGPPLDVISSCLRGFICAAPGHDLIAPDFANIESRVTAWLAGEEWALDAFRAYDRGEGPDIYIQTYARSFGVDPATIGKKDPRRQVGKVEELAFSFGGGLGAWRTMERAYHLPPMADGEVEDIKNKWRAARPETAAYWYDLERAARAAVQTRGAVTTAGPKARAVQFRAKGSFMWAKLPSGRNLCYPYARLDDSFDYVDEKGRRHVWSGKRVREQGVPDGWKLQREDPDCIWYMTVDGTTNKWVETHTYGGKLAENVTQAVARDVLAEALVRLDAAGYETVMHVHDEIVVEVPASAPESEKEKVEKIMAVVPPWAKGLPIATEAFRGTRYRK